MEEKEMKRIVSLILGVALLCTLSFGALAEGKQITVTGTATVSLAADTCTIQLGTSTRALTVAEAQQQDDQTITAVIKALRDTGISEKDIVTSQYNVMAEIPYQDYGTIKPAAPVYSVTNMLFVTIRDMSKVSQAIDVATKAGANQIYGLTFSSSKDAEAYTKALQRAVEDAMNKGKVLAEASGKTLGSLQSISATSYAGDPYGIRNSMEMMDAGAKSSTIVSGDVTVSADVTLIYSFE
jgi:uncharacterized protein YggE